ncbi:MAG TPA: HAD-IIIC family phosphatase [Alphaproteobacteria bacterium]|nr:HAD-IIIC family phosphatase [Alphaproteobacteria bacterium]
MTVSRPIVSARASIPHIGNDLTQTLGLDWLPAPERFDDRIRLVRRGSDGDLRFESILALSRTRLDYLQCGTLDRELGRLRKTGKAEALAHLPRVRLTALSSSTVEHLLPSIRIAGLRRGLLIDCRVGAYGMVRQELLDPAGNTISGSDFVLIAFDAASILPDTDPGDTGAARVVVEHAAAELVALWRAARERSGGIVIQQLVMDRQPSLFGNLDALAAGAPSAAIRELNTAILEAAERERVLVLDIEALARRFGTRRLFDPTRWHQAKQEIAPPHAPLYGDGLARILMAARGRSRKCLVLDLDNTLWGGVIGDDGLEGIRLGQGSPEGEAYSAFQIYVKRLAKRGIVLAASSKNDPKIALEAFERHPDMVLNHDDFAIFEASWGDKPSALQRIARKLEFGLDALVFFDDNPAERALVRQTLPEVAVPEVPSAPEAYVDCLVDSGWFEAVAFTREDSLRTRHYAADRRRREEQDKAADIDSFLDSLEMEIDIRKLDSANLPRATQLVNKTNQFNLTTRRTNEAEMTAFAVDPSMVVLTGRVKDRFGDSGLITVVVGQVMDATEGRVLDIGTWVMSCRVLGRRIEHAMRDALIAFARNAGAIAILGHYRPTERNGLVKQHFMTLGFAAMGEGEGTANDWRLDLRSEPTTWRSPFRAVRTDV